MQQDAITNIYYSYMACNTQKGAVGRLRKVSFQISLHIPRKLIWNDTFHYMYFFYIKSTFA